ncbi:MAG: hypothetical protein GOVbin1096_105 [Prokaryotic dsDNA virus sp.]|jgi:hypothetical protein|nr:MAG: hypothetical protein GOVbin1096_105 [Prokaryotic dsDNA virus sp.]|tara:strand:+ start:22768 stop:23001 length:234 start_codon:yes stop_codon:yes gene_type:complete
MKRQWFCCEVAYGYLVELVYGDVHVVRVINKNDLYHSLDPNLYMQYNLIRMNEELKRMLFPLTQSLEEAKHIRSEWK